MKDMILIADDDRDIANLLRICLENEGYGAIICGDALSALSVVDSRKVDLILLDVMMPGMDGVEACRRLREKTQIPIIFLSAKGEDIDVINGLMAGGDDYVAKPFNPPQLMSRIKAQLRRHQQYDRNMENALTLHYEDLCVDPQTHQVWVSGKEIDLTFKEIAILEYMLRHKGQILSMRQIYEAVWREDFLGAENTVMTHIANIRRKLNADGNSRMYIKTIWGKGYRL